MLPRLPSNKEPAAGNRETAHWCPEPCPPASGKHIDYLEFQKWFPQVQVSKLSSDKTDKGKAHSTFVLGEHKIGSHFLKPPMKKWSLKRAHGRAGNKGSYWGRRQWVLPASLHCFFLEKVFVFTNQLSAFPLKTSLSVRPLFLSQAWKWAWSWNMEAEQLAYLKGSQWGFCYSVGQKRLFPALLDDKKGFCWAF